MRNLFIEYDNSTLQELSQKLANLFILDNYSVRILNNNTQNNNKLQIINNTPKSFIIGNRLNTDNKDSLEIIYPLRSDDDLAKTLSNSLSKIINVSKYYQLRDDTNTARDYYKILENINGSNGIIIKYGENTLNNSEIPPIIYEVISAYLNNENVYTVKSGDSLYAIAKRFNTSVDTIKNINNLTSNNLSIGQKLIIPSDINNDNNIENIYTVKSGDSLYAIAKRFNTSVEAIKNANNLMSNNLSIGQILIIPSNINTNNNTENIYTVKSGDSLYAIAKRFNTSVDAIKSINNLTSNNLSIGQKLIIASNTQNIYTVKSGDSLYAIAKRFNTSIDAIKNANNLTSNNLSIGQELIIP